MLKCVVVAAAVDQRRSSKTGEEEVGSVCRRHGKNTGRDRGLSLFSLFVTMFVHERCDRRSSRLCVGKQIL